MIEKEAVTNTGKKHETTEPQKMEQSDFKSSTNVNQQTFAA